MKKEYILPSMKISEFHSAKPIMTLSESEPKAAVEAAKDDLLNTVEISRIAVFELD